uniref:Uncharacterized protein n=1 Tax=Photinus pyralis TaxID=7054 RepID=A0A1Y1M800_PHOPY
MQIHDTPFSLSNGTPCPSFIVAEEHLDRHPAIANNLGTSRNPGKLGRFRLRQAPSIKIEVGRDARRCHALGDDTCAALHAPFQQNLSGGLALRFGNLGHDRVLRKTCLIVDGRSRVAA